MKRPLLGMIAALGAAAVIGQAGTAYGYVGYYGYAIELDGTGALATHSGQTTLYAVNPGNSNGDVVPTGSTATYDATDWTSSSTGTTPTYNLGTFNTLLGDSLILKGGSILTFSGSGDTVDTGTVEQYYIITPVGGTGSTVGVPVPLDVTGVDSTAGNDRFATESKSINLLSGLTSGIYNLSSYGVYTYNGVAGTGYANNGGKNFGAVFTVASVPEPASLALVSLSGLAALRRRRLA